VGGTVPVKRPGHARRSGPYTNRCVHRCSSVKRLEQTAATLRASVKRRLALWAAVLAGSLVVPAVIGAQASPAADPDWLATVNYWRAAAGVPAVSDQSAWDNCARSIPIA